ncbi:YdcF family protein [Luteimonas sp. SX5]|uniref:YdcF family protein n=1 Tax=Luteimonas galliterrae TaxID=2940486 RepID=A0ABT0MJ39_9GAMM|nr:YdcF family protein [Luteimonas galliterrae]MCL1634889.1 YdcF family protein [Luteimonas galliterrae]
MPSIQDLVVSLTYPPTLSAALLACAGLGLCLRMRNTAVAISAFAIAWSLVWSVPRFSDGLRGHLESRYPVADEAALPDADAIVVLGGGHYGWINRPGLRIDQLESSRIAAGARAWLSGRAPIVVLSGGGSEARTMAKAIARFGVPASALILEDRSRNTRDNASFTAALTKGRGVRRILLVTSSLHMPRASLLFREAGIDVVPVPVPERARRATWRERWVPSFGALWRSGRALKEYVGLLAVRLQN